MNTHIAHMQRHRLCSPALHPSGRSKCVLARAKHAGSSRQLFQITSTGRETCKTGGDGNTDDGDETRTSRKIFSGTSSPVSAAARNKSDFRSNLSRSGLFKLVSGYALFAKRPARPFPPPFLSTPSTTSSKPLSIEKIRRTRNGANLENEALRGMTNGDDAALASDRLLAVNDGVGAWAMRERGHAAYEKLHLSCHWFPTLLAFCTFDHGV